MVYRKKINLIISLVFFWTVILNIPITKTLSQEENLRKELVWYKDKKCYEDLKDIKNDIKNGNLIPVPAFFEKIGIENVAVGDIDPDNTEYYWAARKETLGMMLEILKEFKERTGKKEAKLHISGLLRSLEYQNKLFYYNTWADAGRSTHTNGAAVDITINGLFMKNAEEIETLRTILRELHEKEDVYFIDEVGNSCFHICINPDRKEKYGNSFSLLAKEYEISPSYTEENSRYCLLKNKKTVEDEVKKNLLIDISSISEKLPVKLSLPEGSKGQILLRPETAGLISEITDKLGNNGKEIYLTISEGARTEEEQKKLIEENPLLPKSSPFLYGAAFQVDTSASEQANKKKLLEILKEMKESGDIIFTEKENKKIDIVMVPEVISKYRLAYNNKFISSKKPSSFTLKSQYLYISGFILLSLIGIIIVFLLFRAYKIKKFMKNLKRRKKKRLARKKEKINYGNSILKV